MDTKIIRKAICTNRGGLNDATDDQILIIWNLLDEHTKKLYLQSIKEKEAERKDKDAVSHKPKGTV